GLTVLFFLPPAVSTAHAALAEIFFCMTVSIALVTSPGWAADPGDVDDPVVRRMSTLTTALVYAQIVAGATMRHTGAGLAIPDFPGMFGHAVPDHWSPAIAIHFVHRAGAAIVTIAVLTTAVLVRRRHAGRAGLTVPALLLAVLVPGQLALGASVILTGLEP